MNEQLNEQLKEGPYVFLQPKGSSLCLDLNCDCGQTSHIDGEFVYFMRCPGCGAEYELPTKLMLEKVNPDAKPEGYVADLVWVGN